MDKFLTIVESQNFDLNAEGEFVDFSFGTFLK